jgi:hypothetical protein
MLQKFCSSLVRASVFIKKLTLHRVNVRLELGRRDNDHLRAGDNQGSTFAKRQSHSPSELPERFRGWEVALNGMNQAAMTLGLF